MFALSYYLPATKTIECFYLSHDYSLSWLKFVWSSFTVLRRWNLKVMIYWIGELQSVVRDIVHDIILQFSSPMFLVILSLRGFTKFSRADYVKYKNEGRILPDGVNAKVILVLVS